MIIKFRKIEGTYVTQAFESIIYSQFIFILNFESLTNKNKLLARYQLEFEAIAS